MPDQILKNIERQKFVALLIGLFAAIGLGLVAFQPINSPDYYWHLAMARDWVEKGWSPFVDHYSFTFQGLPIQADPWLAQLTMYGFSKIFGNILGAQAYVMTFTALPLLLIAGDGRWKTRWFILLPLATLYIGTQSLRFEPRPELMSYTFATLLILYLWGDLWGDRLKNNWKTTALLATFFVVWTNVHITVFLGYMILFSYVFEKFIESRRKRRPIKEDLFLLATAGIAILAGFLSPGFVHPLVRIAQFQDNWGKYIAEFEPFKWGVEREPALVLVIMSAILTGYLAVRKKFGAAVLVATMVFMTLRMQKLVLHLMAISLVFSIDGLAESYSKLKSQTLKWVWAVLPLAIFGFCIFDLVNVMPRSVAPGEQDSHFPQGIAKHWNDSHLSGRIMNSYGWGGFIALTFDNAQVYIDGRTNALYSYAHTQRYYEARANPLALQEELKKYSIPFVLADSESQRHLMLSAFRAKSFDLERASGPAVLLRNQSDVLSKQRQALSLFFLPYCLKKETRLEDLADEFRTIEARSETNSAVAEFYETLRGYYSTADKAEFFQDRILKNPVRFGQSRRLIARLLELNGRIKDAISVLGSFKSIDQWDSVYSADVLIRYDKFPEAEALFKQIEIESLTDYDAWIFQQQLNRFPAGYPFSQLPANLLATVKSMSLKFKPKANVSSYCGEDRAVGSTVF